MVTINYDVDQVIRTCEGPGSYVVDDLIRDIEDLKRDLEDCQYSFHAKGSNTNNVINLIYKKFARIIGSSYGDNGGNGLAGLVASSANTVNIVYEEALRDKAILEEQLRQEAIAREQARQQQIQARNRIMPYRR